MEHRDSDDVLDPTRGVTREARMTESIAAKLHLLPQVDHDGQVLPPKKKRNPGETIPAKELNAIVAAEFDEGFPPDDAA